MSSRALSTSDENILGVIAKQLSNGFQFNFIAQWCGRRVTIDVRYVLQTYVRVVYRRPHTLNRSPPVLTRRCHMIRVAY
jgi:hypothetical protein